MGGEQAASVLATVRRDQIEARGRDVAAEDEEAFKAPIRDAVRASRQLPTTRPPACGTTASSTPLDTRTVLGLALAAAAQRAHSSPSSYGVFRM